MDPAAVISLIAVVAAAAACLALLATAAAAGLLAAIVPILAWRLLRCEDRMAAAERELSSLRADVTGLDAVLDEACRASGVDRDEPAVKKEAG